MNRQERLKFCKTCQKREFDLHRGILCGLTHEFAVFEESCPDYEQDQKIQILENYKKDKNEEKQQQLEERKRRQEEKKETRKKKSRRVPEKISKHDIFLILAAALITLFIVRVFTYASFYTVSINLGLSTLLGILIISTASQLFREKENIRFRIITDLKFNLIYSALFSLIYLFYALLLIPGSDHLLMGLLLLSVITFVISFFSVILVFPLRYLFRKTRRNPKLSKIFLLAGAVLLFIISTLEGDLFIKRTVTEWNAGKSVSSSDFRGYPNFLTKYAAAISSSFVYEIKGNAFDSIEVKTVMYQHHSWIKDPSNATDYLLRHEQYHFNISEILARKFKKDMVARASRSFNEKQIKEQYYSYLWELNSLQNKYDKDAKHSIDLERQLDWEYLIDSMLCTLDIYSKSIGEIIKPDISKPAYCRYIFENGDYTVVPRYPIDSSIAMYSRHYELSYNAEKIVRIEFFDGTEAMKDDFFNVHRVEIEYRSDRIMYSFFDADGKPAKNQQSVYQKIVEKKGNKILVSFLDSSGQQTITRDGIFKTEWDTDAKGRRVSGRFFDKNGQRTIDEDGNYLLAYVYDLNGNIVEVANFDDNLLRADNSEGIAYTRYLFDAMNNMVKVLRYNSKNHLSANRFNIAEENYAYDSKGNIILMCFKNTLGNLMIDNNRVAISYFRFDEYSNCIEKRQYGMNKNLIITEEGIGRQVMKYDSIGRISEKANYDAYGKPLNDKEGRCKIIYEYDDGTLPLQTSWYSYSDSGKVHFYNSVAYTYNDYKNVILESFQNADGSIFSDSMGISFKGYTYDNRQRLTEVFYMDRNKQAVAFKKDVYRICYEYDEQNNQNEIAYYNIEGELASFENGIARETAKYNKDNKRTEARYFGTDNRPVTNDIGVELIKWSYNLANKTVEESYFTSSGTKTNRDEGYSSRLFFFDSNDQIKSILHYNAAGDPADEEEFGVFEISYEYDDLKNLTRTVYKDRYNKLTHNTEGYAIENYYYDRRNRLTRMEFLNKFRFPVLSSTGYSSENYTYDLNDNLITKIYRDEANSLCTDENGIAIYNMVYNRNGEMLSSSEFGADECYLDSINKGSFSSPTDSYLSHRYSFYPNNYEPGYRTDYYSNGQKKSEAYYIDGKIEGIYTSWYENGNVSSEIEYHNGVRDGKTIDYYSNGVKWREMMYRNNNIIIESVVNWHINGQLHSKYINGEEVFWDENGRRQY